MLAAGTAAGRIFSFEDCDAVPPRESDDRTASEPEIVDGISEAFAATGVSFQSAHIAVGGDVRFLAVLNFTNFITLRDRGPTQFHVHRVVMSCWHWSAGTLECKSRGSQNSCQIHAFDLRMLSL